YGLEAWGDYQAQPGWRLSASLTYLGEVFAFKPGASALLPLTQAANDPKYQAQLRSSMDLGPKVTFDTALRYVSALPDPRVPGYAELNARLGWDLTERLRLSLDGRNLLHARHVEYVAGSEIPRSVFADLQWRF
ncbi:MAG: TonB-dependent receptor, partial [Phenylobacterium sp.]|nr:TonB-dependent receptor [Phenylobacterium sp.]